MSNNIDCSSKQLIWLKNHVQDGAKHSTPGLEISEKVQFRKLADISLSGYEFQLEISTNK